MNSPYRSTMQALKAALSVGAASMYKAASWQNQVGTGYREHNPWSNDLSKLESFQQACMTFGLLHNNMPPHLWAVLVVKHAPALSRDGRLVADKTEVDFVNGACLVAAGHLPIDRVRFARWAVAYWARRLPPTDDQWAYWKDKDCGGVSTLRRINSRVIKPALIDMERIALIVAEDLLKSRGVVENQEAA